MLTINPYDLSVMARVSVLCGFDLDQVLREVDSEGYQSVESAGYLDIQSINRVYELAIKQSSRSHFPFLIGDYFAFDHAPEVNAFLSSSPSIRHALRMLEWLPLIMQPELLVWYEVNNEKLRMFFDIRAANQRIHSPGYVESAAIVGLRLVEQMLGYPIQVEVSFRHQPLISIDHYQRQFGVIPVFNEEHNIISMPAELLDLPLQYKSSILHAKSQLMLSSRLNQLQAMAGLPKTISILISQSPATTIDDICLKLGLGKRSLQRRLQESGTSFHAIQSTARAQLSKVMLLDENMDMESIALKLGFMDADSFNKAFQRWEGQSPSQYRRNTKK